MTKLTIAAIAMAFASQAAEAADDFVYPQTVTFAATRNGGRIGTHSIAFSNDGGQRRATTTIDLAVTFIGITAYRYSHRSEEVWSGDRLQSLASQTDDNGKRFAVRIDRVGDKLAVLREEGQPAVQAAGGDQGIQKSQPIKELVPGDLMPTSHWNLRQTAQTAAINSQTGVQAKIAAAPLGLETIKTSARSLQAMRYRYTGDLRKDQWFDDRGRWVKSVFQAPDGSTIEYTLQE